MKKPLSYARVNKFGNSKFGLTVLTQTGDYYIGASMSRFMLQTIFSWGKPYNGSESAGEIKSILKTSQSSNLFDADIGGIKELTRLVNS